MNDEKEKQDQELKEIFPLFSSWNKLYLFVLGELLLLIVLFYFFSQHFS